MYQSKKGIVFEYETPDGTQKAIAYHDEQKPEFANYKKVFLRLINDDFTSKMENGKRLISLKSETLLKIIGYID